VSDEIITVVEQNKLLVKELDDTKTALREATKTADRVPSLQQEITRHEAASARAEEKFSTQARLTDEAKENVRDLESRLRNQDVIEAEKVDAENRLEAALRGAQEIEKKLHELEALREADLQEIATLAKEVDRLLPHEAQTKALIEAIDKGRELG
jgi:hypothetical protein